ncbi:PLP-dependent transferase [Actinocrispum wychmicini]|uniref:PLP-dependent transferase n=1 Tax=Actinocrispum wychmicini TaxID=1213861 RepID=UPI00104A6777|nr:PLP-dependent transferase [Actinocrispum wychmicini]
MARPRLRCLSSETAEGADAEAATDLLLQMDSSDRRLRAAGRAMRDHARYCERNRLPVDRPVIARLTEAIENARTRIAQERVLLAGHGTSDRPELLSSGELVLRFALATYGYVRDALEWCVPACAQSHAVQFFDPVVQRTPVPAHARYGEASVREVERQTADLLGLPGTHTISATSSGQAAYTLVEAVLLRERLRPGDLVLTASTLHHEAADQLTALPFIRTLQVAGHTVDDLLAAVVRYQPRCLFLAPLGSTARQHIVDVGALLRRLTNVATQITVVIDGTTMSGALPGEVFSQSRGVEVIYYESASTYLQLGLDTAMAGIVAHPVALQGAFARQRAATSTVLYRHGADLFPRYTSEIHRRRMLRVGRNAEHVATALAENAAVSELGVVCHPSLPGHPDAHLARRLPHAGGCVTFWFHDPGRNRRADLDGVCACVLANARALGVQLTAGVGFGFSVPRLCVLPAGVGPTDDTPCYLRLSVGDRGDQLHLLVDAVASAVTDPVARVLAG